MRDFVIRFGSIDLAQVPVRALRWWLGELQGFLPKPGRDLLHARRREILVDLSAIDLRVTSRAGGKSETLKLAIDELQSGGLLSERAAILRWAKRGSSVVVLLPEFGTLRRSINLPLVAKRNLKDILTFEVDRQSPLDSARIHFDYQIVAQDKASNKIAVELRIIKRELVERALSICSALGLHATELRLPRDEHPLDIRHAVPTGNIARQVRGQRRLNIAMCAVAFLLTAAILEIVIDRKQSEVNAVAQEISQIKKVASGVERMRQDSAKLASRLQFVVDERQKVLVSKIFDETTRVLPDGSWIFQLELNVREVRVRGYSSAAASLIPIIDGSPLFMNARFRAPLTQGPRGDLQRFEMSFDVKPGAR